MNMKRYLLVSMLLPAAALALSAGLLGGCNQSVPAGYVEIRPPLSLTLPHTIRIHPFTGLRVIDDQGQRGLEVRVEALDAYQDTAKAFGKFRFELHVFRPMSSDIKGARIESWEADITNARTNVVHWDPITRSYVFKLRLNDSIPTGRELVLTASFESPYSISRLFAADYRFVSQ